MSQKIVKLYISCNCIHVCNLSRYENILNLIAMEYNHEDWWKEIFCNALQNLYKFTVQKLNNESIVWWKMNENVWVFFLAFAFTYVHWIMSYIQNNCIGYFMKNAITWSISLHFFLIALKIINSMMHWQRGFTIRGPRTAHYQRPQNNTEVS